VGGVPEEQPDVLAVTEFDELDPARAAAVLAPCCASRRWTGALVRGRPYGDLAALTAASDAAVAGLEWPDLEEALAAHPRIGAARAGPGREAAWSAAEQQAAAGAGAAERDQLAAANAAYEERFGHVFLICASGRSAGEMLAELRERMANDPGAERGVVQGELVKITELRLRKLFT
jgi:2-oxo-4-hydroxy-4-carboxy-5-ureidoimidazoline decarboxylase